MDAQMQQDSMLNAQWRSGLIAFAMLVAIEAGLAACDRAPDRAAPDRGSNSPTATTTTAPVSLPPSAVAGEATKASGTANANDQPMKSMSKEEESTSMPKPGQANDDSTVAGDSKK
jgi:hypothetical protein